MKINEDCVNHNAMLLISNEVLKIGSYDFTDSTISYINGVLDMANAMKEVLEVK